MLKYLKNFGSFMNNSKLFAGIVMIMLNILSKYITVKFSKSQEAFLRNYVGSEILIFAVCWMGTKDLFMALMMTAAFFVLSQHLFHEDSKFCVLPPKYRKLHKLLDLDGDGNVSQKEINEAVEILKRAKAQKTTVEREKVYSYFTQNKLE
jgi:hypothetical protein